VFVRFNLRFVLVTIIVNISRISGLLPVLDSPIRVSRYSARHHVVLYLGTWYVYLFMFLIYHISSAQSLVDCNRITDDALCAVLKNSTMLHLLQIDGTQATDKCLETIASSHFPLLTDLRINSPEITDKYYPFSSFILFLSY
jgi:hypothetical protein